MKKLSISVVCFESPPNQLEALIFSLLASVENLRRFHEVSTIPLFIIDNSDEPGASFNLFVANGDLFRKLEVELKHIGGHGNIGYGRAHNLALKRINSDFHLILNPDVTLGKDALRHALTEISAKSEIKMLTPYATDLLGVKQHLCKRYPSVFILLIRGLLPRSLKKFFARQISSYEMRGLSEEKTTESTMLISGCFMLIDTTALKSVKGFDQNYFLYFEDFDLSIRIGELGKVVYAPKVRITHAGGNSSSKGLWHFMRFAASGIKFFNTHGWRLL
tara:strand:- start:245 stop:1072 length:828 start_codon:yes stop_codon:yes gene_type:complete